MYCLVHVIVATPGRIIDLMEKGIANMSQCQILVLDEADKLLSMDYQKPLDRLISFLPSDRQILLYSATFPTAIRGFMVSGIYLENTTHLQLCLGSGFTIILSTIPSVIPNNAHELCAILSFLVDCATGNLNYYPHGP